MQLKTIFLGIVLSSSLASAAVVKSAQVNVQKGTLEVTVSYGGGCAQHKFDLVVNPQCLESFPVQCSAKLVHDNGGDTCEAYITQVVSFSLAKKKLNDPYFKQASLTIHGDANSKVTVRLP